MLIFCHFFGIFCFFEGTFFRKIGATFRPILFSHFFRGNFVPIFKKYKQNINLYSPLCSLLRPLLCECDAKIEAKVSSFLLQQYGLQDREFEPVVEISDKTSQN